MCEFLILYFICNRFWIMEEWTFLFFLEDVEWSVVWNHELEMRIKKTKRKTHWKLDLIEALIRLHTQREKRDFCIVGWWSCHKLVANIIWLATKQKKETRIEINLTITIRSRAFFQNCIKTIIQTNCRDKERKERKTHLMQ